MKSMYFFGVLCTLLLSGRASATTLSRDDLFVYCDFTTLEETQLGYSTIKQEIAPLGCQFNPVFDQRNIHSTTGGYGKGGYVGGSQSQYGPVCEGLYTGQLTSNPTLNSKTKGMAFSLKFCDIGDSGISIFSAFTGSPHGLASFAFTGDSLHTFGGESSPTWEMDEKRASVHTHTDITLENVASLSEPIQWQSLVVSMDKDGYSMEIYLDGALFASTFNADAWTATSGYLNKIRFGADGNDPSIKSDGLYSDFAIWNRSLTETEASWLAGNSTAAVLPEPATTSLSLLGMAALLIRRRR